MHGGICAAGGGFAEYIRVMEWIVGREGKAAGLIKIPDDIPLEQASFIEPVNTCSKAVRLLGLQADETVLVMGQGPIGILLAALARRTGATVLTSDLYAERHAIAAKFGLDRPLDARGDVVAAAKAATDGRGADVALVAVGADALIRTAMDAIRPGGRVMLFASTQHGEAPFDPAAVCMDEKTLMGSYSSSVAINDEVAQLVFEGYRDGSFDLTRLISHRFALEDAVDGDRSGVAPAGRLNEDRDQAVTVSIPQRAIDGVRSAWNDSRGIKAPRGRDHESCLVIVCCRMRTGRGWRVVCPHSPRIRSPIPPQ